VAYPDSLLVEGEHVVLHRHPHWKMLVLPVLVLLAGAGLVGYLAALVRHVSWHRIAWIVLAVLAVLVVGRLTLAPVMRWRTTHFVVTTRRVLVREGVLSRHGIDLPMSRITSARFRRNLFERMLGCGTLVVESSSEPLEFDDIPGVEKVHSLLYQEVVDPDDEPAAT